jgi:hypothetical protein
MRLAGDAEQFRQPSLHLIDNWKEFMIDVRD